MTLSYRGSEEPITVTRLVVTITSPPGIGKTSLASTAGCVMIDADNGQERTPYRSDALTPLNWADCLEVHEHPMVKASTAVCVDTVGRVADICAASIVKENAKGTVHGGALSLQGYGVLRSRMIPWLHGFAGKDLILLSHQKEERKRDDLIIRPDIVGSTLQEILRSSHLIGYLSLVNGQRVLDFSPTEDRLGKNSAQLPVLTIPELSKGKSTFLADLLSTAKANMSHQSEESLKAESQVSDWRASIETLSNAEDVNGAMATILASDPGPVQSQAKKLLVDKAKALGLTFDKASKQYK